MSAPRHLLTLWNPSYAEDALDAHLRVLLRWAERSRDPADPTTADDVYVRWAKIKSPNRDEPLPHAAEIAAIDAQAREGVETHLYLTDYRSLYVGDLGEVTADDVRAEEGEAEHAPSYYRGMEADFWFSFGDLRLPPLGRAAAGGGRHAGGDRGAASPGEHALPRPPGVALRRHGRAAADRHPRRRRAPGHALVRGPRLLHRRPALG